MAIQPIDLQALFSQVEKVGKTQASQKEGLAIQQAIQGGEIQRRTDESIQSVNETQDTGRGTEEISDRNAHKRNSARNSARNSVRQQQNTGEGEEDGEQPKISAFRDPALGRYVDFTG
jgi:hypothetical protein